MKSRNMLAVALALSATSAFAAEKVAQWTYPIPAVYIGKSITMQLDKDDTVLKMSYNGKQFYQGGVNYPKGYSPANTYAETNVSGIYAYVKIYKDTAKAAAMPVGKRYFADDSFWYTPIPEDVELNPNSANYVREFLRQKTAYYDTVNINTKEFASPVYVADSKTPKQRVNEWDCQKKGYRDGGLLTQWASVPIPSYALASAGTDKEMTIYDPTTDSVYEFWQAKKDAKGNWTACWGGRLEGAKSSDGSFNKHYGTTATSLAFLGGQVTAEELEKGVIDHAIGIALVDLEHWNIFSYPAHRSDGYNPKKVSNRIPEGMRFRLDPTVNVDALKMTKAAKTIAKAAQKYGFIVWDHAGAISIRMQNTISYTAQGKPSPYPALFENKPSYEVMKNFPWERLQFLPMNYGQPQDAKK